MPGRRSRGSDPGTKRRATTTPSRGMPRKSATSPRTPSRRRRRPRSESESGANRAPLGLSSNLGRNDGKPSCGGSDDASRARATGGQAGGGDDQPPLLGRRGGLSVLPPPGGRRDRGADRDRWRHVPQGKAGDRADHGPGGG